MTRQEAIETIQTAIAQVEWDYPMDYTVALDKAVEALEQPEIIQCKDCVYWQDNNEGYPHKDCKWREDETPDPEDFCSAGERKNDDA